MAARLSTGEADDLVETHEINVTPFIDVILVLLIIFMVAAPLSTVDVNVDLPASTATPVPRPEKPVFVTLKDNKDIALGDEILSRDSLGAALAKATENDTQKRIFVRADKAVSYGDVMELMNLLRSDGYLKIGLVGLDAGKHDAGKHDEGDQDRHAEAVTTATTASFYREPPRGDAPIWIVAALVVVALHVGIAVFLLHHQPPEPTQPTVDAVQVDLEPIDAPAPQANDVAPPPPQEEKQEFAPPPPEVPPPTETKPPEPIVPPPPPPEALAPPALEPPPPEELPVLPKVEAPIEPPKPDPAIEEQKREQVRREEQRRQQIVREREEQRKRAIEAKRQEQLKAKRQADQAQKAQERREAAAAKAAASRERAQREATAARASGASVAAWKAAVSAQVRSAAQSSGASAGRVVVSFSVSASGGIGGVSVSGSEAGAVRSAIAGIGAVSPPPDGRTTRVTVPISFR